MVRNISHVPDSDQQISAFLPGHSADARVNFPPKGSSEFLLEGDLYIPKTRNAMKCLNKAFNCLWPKSSDGKVWIPYIISDKYGRWSV